MISMWTGNNFTRPLRVAGAAALAPFMDKVLKKTQKTLKLQDEASAFLFLVILLIVLCGSAVGLLILSRMGTGQMKFNWRTGLSMKIFNPSHSSPQYVASLNALSLKHWNTIHTHLSSESVWFVSSFTFIMSRTFAASYRWFAELHTASAVARDTVIIVE